MASAPTVSKWGHKKADCRLLAKEKSKREGKGERVDWADAVDSFVIEDEYDDEKGVMMIHKSKKPTDWHFACSSAHR